LLTETLEWQERTHRGAIALTSIYANLGENDKAFEWLERAFEEHSGYLPVIAYDWAFDRLRQDPRMEEMIARVGLR
jgi:lipopolysaccharide biosynthesis regulator YciM